MGYILVAAAAVAALALLETHRKAQTGAIRLNRGVGTGGVLLMALAGFAIAAPFGAALKLLALGVAAGGAGLLFWYLRFFLRAEEEGFLWQTVADQRRYRYDAIVAQRRYLITGGNVLLELHLADGKAVSLQGNMEGVREFLDLAFDRWMTQKGLTLAQCPFHDPENGLWFPETED